MDNKGGGKYTLRRNDLLYPELSFKANGVLFEVYKQLGGGHNESYYQKAVAIGLKNAGIKFVSQRYVPLKFQDEKVGKYYLDFLIEDKIVLELKRGHWLPVAVLEQVKKYLESLNLDLAIVACFANDGVIIKRVINEKRVLKTLKPTRYTS
ncbi:MAG: GxxExxY protein [Candidatus Magasanikbacteria bacterium]|nr:GxxExxY protein [Candidatus Magasanikbacteria bacterium]